MLTVPRLVVNLARTGNRGARCMNIDFLDRTVIVTGAVVYHMRIEQLEAEPSLVSKLNTFAQILLVLVVMFSRLFENIPVFWMDALTYSVLITIVWSGFDYVWTWGRRAWTRGEH